MSKFYTVHRLNSRSELEKFTEVEACNPEQAVLTVAWSYAKQRVGNLSTHSLDPIKIRFYPEGDKAKAWDYKTFAFGGFK